MMGQMRIPPAKQPALWIDLYHQYPNPNWGEQCLAQAERVSQLLRRAASLAPEAITTPIAIAPPISTDTAQTHFFWQGDNLKIPVEILRGGITKLTKLGLISSSEEQQNALRRGLGHTSNLLERTTNAPWVLWYGPNDMLWLLIEGLWEMKLISCMGGIKAKWNTACCVFLHADGTPYGNTLRNSRCTNAQKRALLEKDFFAPFRHFLPRS